MCLASGRQCCTNGPQIRGLCIPGCNRKTCGFFWSAGAVFLEKTWKQKPSKDFGHQHWLLIGEHPACSILNNVALESRALICGHPWEQHAAQAVFSSGSVAHQGPGMVTQAPNFKCSLGSCCGRGAGEGVKGPQLFTSQSEAWTGRHNFMGDMLVLAREWQFLNKTSPLGSLFKLSFWLLFKTNPAGRGGKRWLLGRLAGGLPGEHSQTLLSTIMIATAAAVKMVPQWWSAREFV